MNLQDLSLEQLKEIRDGAPEGATHVIDYDDLGKYDYLKDPDTWVAWYGSHWNKPGLLIDLSDKTIVKLSDIRARIAELEPVFKVGDRVVILQDTKTLDERYVHFIDDVDYKLALISGEWIYLKNFRHATPVEIAAGHRIDELEAQKDISVTLSAESADIKGIDESEKPVFKVGDRVVHDECNPLRSWYAQIATILEFEPSTACIEYADGVTSWIDLSFIRHATPEEIATGHRIDEPSSSCGMTAAEIDQFGEDLRSKPYVDFLEFEQPDTITVQLGPNKCHKVDPALAYDSPGDCPKDDFDAMSEKHRSPSCKCHEFPIDAELKPDPVNHPSHYTSDPSGIECIQITRHRNFNIGNAIKYLWRAGLKDQAATIQDLQKAIWYINDEIARLEGEQGE